MMRSIWRIACPAGKRWTSIRSDSSYDVAAYLKTLEIVKSLQAKIFVPAHAAASENVADLAQHNIDTVLEIAEKITGVCRDTLCFEAILQRLFTDYGLTTFLEKRSRYVAIREK